MKNQLFSTLFTLILLLISLQSVAQNEPVINATVSGKIVDARTNRSLIGAELCTAGCLAEE